MNCEHNPKNVVADILEGDCNDRRMVQWCRTCGAVRVVFVLKHTEEPSAWRIPSLLIEATNVIGDVCDELTSGFIQPRPEIVAELKRILELTPPSTEP